MSVLFVSGGSGLEHSVYEQESRGYWSAALPCALEKHGLLFDTAGPEALMDRSLIQRHTVLLVGRQGGRVWSEELVDWLAGLSGGAILEAPVPAVVADRLGVRDQGAHGHEGALNVVAPKLRRLARAYGVVPGGAFGTGTSRPVELRADQNWPVTGAPLGQRQAEAWRAPGWDVRRWSVQGEDAKVLAEWTPYDTGRPQAGIVQRGALVGCCAGLYAFLGQSHTVAPFQGGEHRNWPRTDGLETLLLALIDLLCTRAGRTRVRLLPWPRGFTWSMHIRHDVDRAPKPRTLRAAVARHHRSGTCATWYWRTRHLKLRRGSPVAGHEGNQALRVVADADCHEVALHTEALWQRPGDTRERETLETVLGERILGSSAHGDPACFRFQGAPNLIWAEQQRLLYTEMISHAHSHPHRAALLCRDGRIELTHTVCLPHHASFDRSMKSGDALPEQVRAEADRICSRAGLLQILSHPDINLDELFELLASLPREGRWDIPAWGAMQWWTATHVDQAIALSTRADGALMLASLHEVAGLQIELRDPDGSSRLQVLSMAPGDRCVLS